MIHISTGYNQAFKIYSFEDEIPQRRQRLASITSFPPNFYRVSNSSNKCNYRSVSGEFEIIDIMKTQHGGDIISIVMATYDRIKQRDMFKINAIKTFKFLIA